MTKVPLWYGSCVLPIREGLSELQSQTDKPRSQKGEQIPLTARIFALVDVWDALRTDRLYRASWPVEKVRAHVKSLAGTHFDPHVVEVCLASDILFV